MSGVEGEVVHFGSRRGLHRPTVYKAFGDRRGYLIMSASRSRTSPA